MTLDRFLDWLPIVVLLSMMAGSRLWAAVMARRGVRAIVIDWQRPLGQLLYDTLVIAAFLGWFYVLLSEAWPFSTQWLPRWLLAKPIDLVAVRLAGAALLLAAPLLFGAALRSIGTSWRIGIDTRAPGPLVTTGLFAWIRNPIYAAFYLAILGAALVHGRVIALLLAAALILLIHGVVLREERFLSERFGDEFRDYCRRVGRYGI